ncbi:MAG: 30S ribosomal protein S7 [Mycoplasmataceae bacterium RC_NB112A]|nr:MAG: 30S ribosomal protein S7 [Mycoplasmataceae bacterium RC_NB112A]
MQVIMAKRSKFKSHPLKPDRIYGSTTIWKLINKFMWDGKKEKAEKIVYEAAEKVEKWWAKEMATKTKEIKDKEEKKVNKEKNETAKAPKKTAPFSFSQIWEEKVLRNAEFDLEMVRGKPVQISQDRFRKIFFCWLVEVVRSQKKGRKKNPKPTSEILAEEIIQLSNNTGKVIEKKNGLYRDARRAKGFIYTIPSPATTTSDQFTPKV